MKRMSNYRLSWCALVVLLFLLVFFIPSCSTSSGNGETGALEIIRKEPYLIYTGNNTSMTVTWQTNRTPTYAYVEWGDTPSSTDNRAYVQETGNGKDQHQFFHTITELIPGTRTYYRVVTDGEEFTGSFKTAPLEKAQNLTFYAYGDTRSHPEVQNRVVSQMLDDIKQAPDTRQTFCTHSGDFTMDGMDEIFWDMEYFNRNYPNTIKLLANMPILGACGNHEIYRADYVDDPAHYGYLLRKYWPYTFLQESNHCYYSVDYGPVHLAVIDQYTAEYGQNSAQRQWLLQDLGSTNKPWKIVMFHRPAWSAGNLGKRRSSRSEHGDDTVIQDYYHPAFVKHNVKAVIQGHQHYYSRCRVDGVDYLTLGGGGAPLSTPNPDAEHLVKTTAQYHFGRFDISGNIMKVKVVNIDGQEIDSFQKEL